jgi:hypothetical protein
MAMEAFRKTGTWKETASLMCIGRRGARQSDIAFGNLEECFSVAALLRLGDEEHIGRLRRQVSGRNPASPDFANKVRYKSHIY